MFVAKDLVLLRLLILLTLVTCVICDAFPRHPESNSYPARLDAPVHRLERRFTNTTSALPSSTSSSFSSTVDTSSSLQSSTITSQTTQHIFTSTSSSSLSTTSTTSRRPTLPPHARPTSPLHSGSPFPDHGADQNASRTHRIHLSTAAKIGIWIGVAGVCLLAVAALLWMPRRRTKKIRLLEAKALTKFDS